MYIDTSGFTRLAEKYRVRANNISTTPFGGHKDAIKLEIKMALYEAMMAGENITLSDQIDHYKRTGKGYFGADSAGRDRSSISPQEFIDPSRTSDFGRPKDHVMGEGRMHGSSYVLDDTSRGNITFSLETAAKMRPYAPTSQSPNREARPLPMYIREGWSSIDPKHRASMIPRPQFFERVARTGRYILGTHLPHLLEAAGFIRKR